MAEPQADNQEVDVLKEGLKPIIVKQSRNSIFSAVRGLNLTAHPDAKYRSNLLQEVKEWKRLVRNAVTDDPLPNRSSIPNVSSSSSIESSFLFKIKSYVEDQPDLEQFVKENGVAYEKANKHLIRYRALRENYNAMVDQKDKLILEVSNDLRDDILLDC